jgi:tetratricopeptide (TPR) repeat protein
MKKKSLLHLPFNMSILMVWLLLLSTNLPVRSFAQKKKKDVEKSAEQLAEAEFHFSDGMKYMMIEEYDKAIVTFQKVLAISPDNTGANYTMADAYIRKKEPAKAIPFAEKAYQQESTNKYYALQLADLQVKQKNYSEAEKLYKKIIEQSPQNAEYGIELAAIYLFENKYDDAINAYNNVEKVIGLTPEITQQKQMIWLRQNKTDEAIKESEKLVASDPTETEYMLDLAEMLMAHDRTEQAVPWLERILKDDSANAQAHVMLAESYRKRGDQTHCHQELLIAFGNNGLDGLTKARILSSYASMLSSDASKDGAIELAQMLIKQHPKESKGYMIYGDLLLSRNQKSQARNAYVQSARLDKSIFEMWARIVQLDQELSQPDSVLKHSEEAIDVFPNQPMFWYANGTAYYFKKDFDKSISSLEEARRLANASNDHESDSYRLGRYINALLGDVYNSVGKHQKSDQAYEAALKADPNDDHVLNNYSYYLSLRKEKLPLAVEMASKLAERYPENGTYLDTYAWVLYINKEFAKAKMFLEKAIQHNQTKSGTIVEHYGDVLYQLGEKEKAIEQWKKAKIMIGGSSILDKKISTGQLIE